MKTIDTDYLVIGSGTAGLAFTDTLINEDKGAHVTIVDRHGKPGGHWNDAYPFVALHQPSAFYGVNSMELGQRRIDASGPNKGLYELASGPEISGYFDRVMQHRLLPSGRVTYRPMCNWLGDGVFESILSGERTRVNVRKKTVDAVYAGPSVPSTHRPRFEVADGVRLVPPNALPGLWQEQPARPRRFVILGAGKTAMDACVWLVGAGADPDAIEWVVPRDSWLINRITTQPGLEFFTEAIGGQADQMQAFAEATSIDDLFLRLEACGAVLRIHRDRMPTMFHLATIAPGEVEVLRRIRNVVRLGRVQRIAPDRLQLEHGRVEMPAADALFIDCTASAVEARPIQPIFQDENRIVLNMVRLPQPAFSAALIAYVEAHYDGDETKNRLCTPVPFPHTLAEYPRAVLVNMRNHHQWAQDKVLRQWIRDSRLDGYGKLVAGVDAQDGEKQAILARLKAQSRAAMVNLPSLMGS